MSVPMEQASTPAREIDEPERFAGRATILNDLAGALGLEGGHIVIFGNRGVGKSSVGRQREALSRADPRIVAKMPGALRFDFLPVYFQCEDSVHMPPW